MIVRKPQFDFEHALPHWSWHREFAQAFNAASTTLPHLEPYLNRVIRKARDEISPERIELLEAIDLFMRQEANHYRQHQRYNAVLERAGYAELASFETRLREDYAYFLEKKSLRFNIAYAEGFESLGIIYAAFFFERIDDLLAGADVSVTRLWQWHLAEEFEHRTVCHDVYHALYGGYWPRLYGLLYALWHLGAYGARVTSYLLKRDRRSMNARERLVSRWRAAGYQWRLLKFALPRVLGVMSPRYNPRFRAEPRGAGALLADIEAA